MGELGRTERERLLAYEDEVCAALRDVPHVSPMIDLQAYGVRSRLADRVHVLRRRVQSLQAGDYAHDLDWEQLFADVE